MIEGFTIRFIHEKLDRTNAIILLLDHGWPGSFLELVPIINRLTQNANTSTAESVFFKVIVPSLMGPAFSTPALAQRVGNLVYYPNEPA